MKHWKKLLSLTLVLALVLALAGCGGTDTQDTETEEQTQTEEQAEEPVTGESYAIAALKGPTAMGLVKLMSEAESGADFINDYTFTLAASADEVSPLLMKGELDMACVPANLAAVLYQKTEGDIVTLAVNTLGVLYIVENGNAVQSMADLKGTLNTVVEKLYGKGTKTRFRPHHFPFTEPSCEMDVQCHKCGGVGCPTCKGEGWIELLGAGMIHPKVLKMSGIDPEVYSGWAFGIGLERTAMRRFKIADLRLIFENDVRFLEQF